MIRSLFTLGVLLLLPALPAIAEDADDVVGVWLMDTGKHRARIDITKQGDQYEGHISWLEEPAYPENDRRGMAGKPKVDRDNPDPALRDRPLIGLKILAGLTYDGAGQWSGHIYAPDSGKSYRAKVRLTEGGVLKVRGYIGISLLGRTMDWTRAAAAEVSEDQ